MEKHEGKLNLITEKFSSIAELMTTLEKRENNAIMKSCHSSSEKGDKGWYGTDSFEEASQLMRTGYTEVLPKIKEGLKTSSKVISRLTSDIPRRKQENSVIGFVPNVPNALLNLPNSMIDVKMIVQKRKTLNIVYIMSGSAAYSIDMWIKAGISLLTAIKIIERMGISVKIDCSFYCGTIDNETAMGSVTVKNYGQPLDIQKLCFPLVNPSMFRRIGFKFLETTPIISKEGFAYGYGRGFEMNSSEIVKKIEDERTYVLHGQWIKDHNYEVKEILNYLNFSKWQI